MFQWSVKRFSVSVGLRAALCAAAVGVAAQSSAQGAKAQGAKAQGVGVAGAYTKKLALASGRPQVRQVGVLIEGRRLLYAETSSVSPGSAGTGYRAIDIMQATPALILADTRGYLSANGTITAQANESLVGNSGSLGSSTVSYWINPGTLVRLVPGRVGPRTISRVKYNQGGQSLNAVSILDQTATDYASDIYELASGLLLSSSHVNVSSGKRVSSTARFFGARFLGVPWANQAAPSWVAAGRQLFYQGSVQNVLAGSNLPPLPASGASLSFALTRTLGNAAQARQTAVFQNGSGVPPVPVVSNRVFGSAGLSGLWIPPAAMGSLRAGQVLDQDSVTGFRTVYAGIQNNAAILIEQGPTQSFTSFYSRQNGMLVGLQNVTRTLNLGEQRISFNLAAVR